MGREDYCNSVLFYRPATHIGKLQQKQNCVTRLVCRTPKFDQITPILKRLRWFPPFFRIEYKVVILTFEQRMTLLSWKVVDRYKINTLYALCG